MSNRNIMRAITGRVEMNEDDDARVSLTVRLDGAETDGVSSGTYVDMSPDEALYLAIRLEDVAKKAKAWDVLHLDVTRMDIENGEGDAKKILLSDYENEGEKQ